MGSAPQKEKILVVERDLENQNLIARQTLAPLGFEVSTTDTASAGLQLAVHFAPDVVIASLDLPDLSGKDLLIALKSQGLDMPFILIVGKGQENAILQAFRLGASDYLSCPIREAEVVSAVERAMQGVRARQERERLAHQLQQTNLELEHKVRDLETIFSIGKAVTSITNQGKLFKAILNGAMKVAEADRGYLLTRREGHQFILAAHARLPAALAAFQGLPLDDGISSLVAISGETLAVNGRHLERFKIARLGQSAIVVPLKAQHETIGLMVMVRKLDRPFSDNDKTLLEAVADYAAVSMVNARLFLALEERAQRLQLALENIHAGQVNP